MTKFLLAARSLAPYQLHRRRLLALGLAAGALSIQPSVTCAALAAQTDYGNAYPPQAALDAVVDTLIPADTLTPAASALGVSRILLQQAQTDAGFKPWLMQGMLWLDQGVAGSFILRSIEARTQLITHLASAAVGTQQRTFFELLRLHTMSAYYADPRSAPGLAVDRPPQPVGYPDFADS